ncbi:hypothetical protein [Burkholderia lata]|uniref:hypothetical protein n=1 Tax=Burkholderia lata (strain ATCC 17760 / DSM 23089 / LMG 22485 / NCIMB 9086 / R18194 / 383) TaxID=482957 RepID=UPI000A9CEF9B|nr:hypothetical protein [Burkholderia lata]
MTMSVEYDHAVLCFGGRMSNIIAVGKNQDSKYVAYGDDCHYPPFCGFAYVVVQRSRIPWVLREIASIKTAFGMPADQRLHCRELFHHHAREKVGLSHLTVADAQSIIIRCLLLVNNAGIHVRFSHARLDEFVATMGNTMNLGNATDGTTATLALHGDPKGLISWLAQMALLVPAPYTRFKHAHDWEVVVSADRTPTRMLGDKRSQAHNLINPFSSIGAPDGMFFQMTPRVSNDDAAPMLQLADVAAYSLTHTLDMTDKGRFWRTQLPSIRLLHTVPYTPIKYT